MRIPKLQGRTLTEVRDFLSVLFFYVERGLPYSVSFKRAKEEKRVKGYNYDELYDLGRALILSYYSLSGKSRRRKVEEFLKLEEPRVALPIWMEDDLKKFIDIEKYKMSLLSRRVWFRINTLKTTNEEKVIRSLESKGIEIERDRDFDYLYKVRSGDLTRTTEFKDHLVIVQDKASVAVVEALEPERRDRIIELASAPGLKAELIFELTEGEVELFLAEVDELRLYKELRLLKEMGVKEDKINVVSQDSTLNALRGGERILLDAPCSSSGTIYSDPSVLISLGRSGNISKYSKIQRKMMKAVLESNFEFAVYSVCSIFPEEGEEILEPYDNIVVKPRIQGAMGYSSYRVGNKVTRLFSWVNDTQDFMIAGLDGNLR